jgi:hypothetical protein
MERGKRQRDFVSNLSCHDSSAFRFAEESLLQRTEEKRKKRPATGSATLNHAEGGTPAQLLVLSCRKKAITIPHFTLTQIEDVSRSSLCTDSCFDLPHVGECVRLFEEHVRPDLPT